MPGLAEVIRLHKDHISQALHIGYANWDALLERIQRQERSKSLDFADEQVWTFLLACAYAMRGLEGANELARKMIADELQPSESRIWFEVLPEPPRFREGSTHLDLAFGDISLRDGMQSGIELGDQQPSWICFVECKWYADIACSVSYDQHRNQLARVIENALYFNRGGLFASEIHVTLVTPETFRSRQEKSRLYQYKFDEYGTASSDSANLIRDLGASCLSFRQKFPDVHDRLLNSKFRLHWISYEELLDGAPDSELKPLVTQFASRYNGTLGPVT